MFLELMIRFPWFFELFIKSGGLTWISMQPRYIKDLKSTMLAFPVYNPLNFFKNLFNQQVLDVDCFIEAFISSGFHDSFAYCDKPSYNDRDFHISIVLTLSRIYQMGGVGPFPKAANACAIRLNHQILHRALDIPPGYNMSLSPIYWQDWCEEFLSIQRCFQCSSVEEFEAVFNTDGWGEKIEAVSL